MDRNSPTLWNTSISRGKRQMKRLKTPQNCSAATQNRNRRTIWGVRGLSMDRRIIFFHRMLSNAWIETSWVEAWLNREWKRSSLVNARQYHHLLASLKATQNSNRWLMNLWDSPRAHTILHNQFLTSLESKRTDTRNRAKIGSQW